MRDPHPIPPHQLLTVSAICLLIGVLCLWLVVTL